ncbi:MAG: DUF4864 domain-containing protein [Burkholderiales bacterium]
MPAAQAQDAGAISAADKAEIRKVIGAQLEAFQHDDAAAAFSLATPAIQRAFRSAENFMKMVKTSYLPVYRPRAVNFLALEMVAGVPIQALQLLGPDGSVVVAFYTMQLQPDKTWKIDGCELAPANAVSI